MKFKLLTLTITLVNITLSTVWISKVWGQNISETEIKTYIEQLKTDPNWQVRSQAAKALEKVNLDNYDTVIPVLITAIKDKDEDEVVRLRATFSLIKIGQPAIDELIYVLGTDNENDSAIASTKFALRRIIEMSRPPSLPPTLFNYLSNDKRQVRSNATSIFREMAADIQWRPISERASVKELEQAVSDLEKALQEMKKFIDPKNKEVLPEDVFWESVGEYERDDVAAIRESLVTFKSEIRSHYARNFRRVVFLTLNSLVLAIGLLFWYRPELFLRWIRSRLRAKQNR